MNSMGLLPDFVEINLKIVKDSNLVSLLPKATEDSGELKRQGRVITIHSVPF